MKGKTGGQAVSLAVMAGSALVLVGAAAVLLVIPRPTVARAVREHAAARRTLQGRIARTRQQADAAQASVQARLWGGDSQTVTAALLTRLLRESDARGVKLVGLRSQKAQDFGAVVELPFALQLAGPYPAVRSLVSSLDAPRTRIAVRSAQMAAADGSSNSVTATIGISVFAKPAQRQDAAAGEGTTHG